MSHQALNTGTVALSKVSLHYRQLQSTASFLEKGSKLLHPCQRRVQTSPGISARRPLEALDYVFGYGHFSLRCKAKRRTLDVSAEQSRENAVSPQEGNAAAEGDSADRKAEELREKLGVGAGVSPASFQLLVPYAAVGFLVLAFRRTVFSELLNLIRTLFSATLATLDFAALLVQMAWAPLSAALAPTKAGPLAEGLGQAATQLPYGIAASIWFTIDALPVATILANMAAAWAAASLIKTVNQTDPWLPAIDIAGTAGLAAGLQLAPWPVAFAALAAVGLYSHFRLGLSPLASATPTLLTALCIGTAPVKVVLLAALVATAVRSHGPTGTWAQLTTGGNKDNKGGGLANGTLAQTLWLSRSLVARVFALLVAVALVGRGALAFAVQDPVL